MVKLRPTKKDTQLYANVYNAYAKYTQRERGGEQTEIEADTETERQEERGRERQRGRRRGKCERKLYPNAQNQKGHSGI